MNKLEAIQKTVEFFRSRWVHKEDGIVFFARMADLLETCQERISLYVDYDPQYDLLKLIQESGFKCSGWGFSAKDFFSGTKFGVFFDPQKQTVQFKSGYGNFEDAERWV